MFWKKDKKPQKSGSKPAKPAAQSSEAIRAQALANARAARAQIGEDTLDRIAAAMSKKQQSTLERAKAQIRASDSDKVVDEILYMLERR